MHNKHEKLRQKFLSCFTLFIFLLNIASPVVSFWGTVYAQELEQASEVDSEVTTEESASEPASQPEELTSEETTAEQPAEEPTSQSQDTPQEENTTVVEEQPQDQEGDILEDGASDYRPDAVAPIEGSVVEEPAAEKVAEEVVEVNELAKEAEETWEQRNDDYYETTKDVNVGETYEAPQNGKVTVKFTKIAEPGKLKIKEVKLSEDEVSDLNALSDVAYDITSSMEDGTFTYDLTLPLPDSAKGKDVEVKFGETVEEVVINAEVVDEPKEIKSETIAITGLDHFTVFVLVNDPDGDDDGDPTDDIANGVGDLTTLDDTWIDQNSPTSTHGSSANLYVRSDDSGNPDNNRRTLIKFDTNPINDDSTITKATLRLFLADTPSTSSRTYQAYRVTGDWSESTLDWDSQPSSEGPTDAVSSGTTNNVWLEWDVTNDVQGFINGDFDNFGWLIKDAVESNVDNRSGKFNSSENGNELRRPQLVVDLAESGDQPTEYNSPSAYATTADGDGNGFENNASNAFEDGGTEVVNRCSNALSYTKGYASNCNNGNGVVGDKHVFYNYGFTVPDGATINGIEVRADWFMDDDGGINSLSVELSWDEGTTWTSAKTDVTETDREHISSFGGSSDKWGRESWTVSELSNSYFRVRVSSNSSSSSRDFALDWIPVRVYYTPVSDMTEPSTSFTSTPGSPTNDNTLDYSGTSTDDSSGIANVEYRVTNNDTSVVEIDWTSADPVDGDFDNELSEDFTFTTSALADGEYTIESRATDGTGNIESTATDIVTIDTVESYLVSQTTFSGWYTNDQTSTFTYADDDTGIVSGTPVTCDITTEGTGQTCSVTPNVCDAAGNCNTSEVFSNDADIDKSLPTDPSDFSSDPAISTPTTDNTVEVSWATQGADSVSGVDGYSYLFSTTAVETPDQVKDIEETESSAISSTLTSGTWYFHIATVDNAGNWTSTEHFGPFEIDVDSPSVETVTVSNDQDPYVDGNGFDIEATVSDAESGIDSALCEYTTDGSTWLSALYDSDDEKCYVENITAADGASLTINMRVSDLAGNQTEGSSISRTADSANPLVDAGSDVTTNSIFTQDATASDSGVGIANYLWEKTSGPGTVTFGSSTSEDTTIEADIDGTYYITLTVEDAFGHSTSDEMVLTWDITNPTDPTPSSASHTTSVWSIDSTVDVTWSDADDTLSGVDGFYTEWNTSPDTMAGAVIKEYEETADSETSPALTDSSLHYFHIATLDNAGNWTSTAHLGPFYIDAGEPNTVLDVYSPDPTKENKPTFTGSTSDTTSNIIKVEYRILIEANSELVNDWTDAVAVDGAFDELFEDFTFTSPRLTGGDRYLFQIRATDDVGNVEITYAEDSLRIQKESADSNGNNSGGDVAGASTQSPLENLIQNLISGTAFGEEAAQETAPENPTEGEVLGTTEEDTGKVLSSEEKKEFAWKWWIVSISIVGGTIYLFFRKR